MTYEHLNALKEKESFYEFSLDHLNYKIFVGQNFCAFVSMMWSNMYRKLPGLFGGCGSPFGS